MQIYAFSDRPQSKVANYLGAFVCAVFFLWAVYGLTPHERGNDLPFKIMDLIFIVSTVFAVLSKPLERKRAFLISVLLLLYVAFDLLYLISFYKTNGYSLPRGLVVDFIYSDKFIVYLAMIAVFRGSEVIESDAIKRLMLIITVSMLAKYGYSQILSLDSRPILFLENNYELMMLLTLFTMYAILERHANRNPSTALSLLIALIIILSGSRSGTIALFPVIFYLYFRPSLSRALIFSFLGPILVFGAWWIFETRSGASGNIDRVQFFQVFMREISDFSFVNYLIGLKPLTPLSMTACQELSYYQSLFSAQENGRCYAIILHGFMMRAMHDHGVIGLIAPFVILYYLLNNGFYTKTERLVLISIGFLCGFSVAGIGANFVAFPLALAVGLRRPGNTRPVRAELQSRSFKISTHI